MKTTSHDFWANSRPDGPSSFSGPQCSWGPSNVMNVKRGNGYSSRSSDPNVGPRPGTSYDPFKQIRSPMASILEAQTCVVLPTEPFIPVANVVRIMQRVVQTHGKIVDDMKEIVQHCVSEFIGVINVEANMHCQSESRRKITADDIM
ncbi:uncharacterized protein LOC124936739 [Impatiens glandulifera]|uniref:uncharacterized protein LOC124936739 n=1 Tax=Impatiens glandulifera TaxID=253017 RepID=UPI001FB13001|nr:uncharacterized protein LOC124936739 [Impatiens glandulifera]